VKSLSETLKYSNNVKRALSIHLPIVALESTVLTHGLPRPQNLQLARDMENTVRENGATPATIGFLDGYLHIGMSEIELERLSNQNVEEVYKVGPREFASVITNEGNGGTTVAGTMLACRHADLKIFATGGIGGVHRDSNFDISADLQALATIPMIVVCAGAKAILDLPATLEYLETMSVPIVGYNTDDFPAFYSSKSGLGVTETLDNPQDIVDFATTHWDAGLKSAVLVANPIPETEAIPRSEMEPLIKRANQEAHDEEINGQDVTPFLLRRINELTQGKSMKANLALLLNNARLAAQIAKSLHATKYWKTV
jgi:pseudouridine-5'-phosphate glycosidase